MAARQRGVGGPQDALERWAVQRVQGVLAGTPHGGKSVQLTNGHVRALVAAATADGLSRRALGTLAISLGGRYAPKNSKPDSVAIAAGRDTDLDDTALFSWPITRQSNADTFEFVPEALEVIDLFADPCATGVFGFSNKARGRSSASSASRRPSASSLPVAVGSKRPRAASTSSQPANSKRLKTSDVVFSYFVSLSHSYPLSRSHSLILSFSRSLVFSLSLCL
jgi:hypothetical protein